MQVFPVQVVEQENAAFGEDAEDLIDGDLQIREMMQGPDAGDHVDIFECPAKRLDAADLVTQVAGLRLEMRSRISDGRSADIDPDDRSPRISLRQQER